MDVRAADRVGHCADGDTGVNGVPDGTGELESRPVTGRSGSVDLGRETFELAPPGRREVGFRHPRICSRIDPEPLSEAVTSQSPANGCFSRYSLPDTMLPKVVDLEPIENPLEQATTA